MEIHTKENTNQQHFDVIIVGAGSAGASAAIACARQGVKTLLLDRLPFLGGTSTAVLDTFYGFYTPGSNSRKVVGGIPQEVVDNLKPYSSWLERPNTHGAGTGVTYHPEYLKVVWESMVQQSGCKVILNTWVQDVEAEGRRVKSVLVATKLGLRRFSANTFIDASGDADVCHFANCGYELAGDLEPAQTLTTTFKLCNVDVAKRQTIKKADFHALMSEAAQSGKYQLPRREGSDHITPVEGMTATIMTRLESYAKRDGKVINATDPELLTDAEIEGRRQAIEYIRFLRDKVPGYENSQLSTFGFQIGVRETRRVYGDYRLSREDVLSAKKFDDQISLCGAPIEDHHGGTDTAWAYLPDGDCVGVPFRTLIARDADNLLVAGRCFSATHDAHASVRSMAQTMSMGQAAGYGAALAVKEGGDVRAVSISQLQDNLRKSGAILDWS